MGNFLGCKRNDETLLRRVKFLMSLKFNEKNTFIILKNIDCCYIIKFKSIVMARILYPRPGC